MQKKIIKIQAVGALFAILVGSFFHFTYEFSGESIWVSWFSAVNESTWEHLKLAFWGIYLFGIFEYFYYGKNNKNFFLAKVKELYLAPIFIVMVFYGYKAITGGHSLFVDILIFNLSIIFAKVIGYYILAGKVKLKVNPIIPLIFIDILTLLFIIFTYVPPKNILFLDPVNGGYGISSRESISVK